MLRKSKKPLSQVIKDKCKQLYYFSKEMIFKLYEYITSKYKQGYHLNIRGFFLTLKKYLKLSIRIYIAVYLGNLLAVVYVQKDITILYSEYAILTLNHMAVAIIICYIYTSFFYKLMFYNHKITPWIRVWIKEEIVVSPHIINQIAKEIEVKKHK